MKIAITGAKGVIGSILSQNLKHEITTIDLPQTDVRNYNELLRVLPNHDVIIHLAWDGWERFNNNVFISDNLLMAYNIYNAAIELNISRVIMASSVHVDKELRILDSEERFPIPSSPYGASKLYIEALGKCYAQQGLEVIIIRFGGINPENKIYDKPYYQKIWLSHEDCIELVDKCIQLNNVPFNFLVQYGISKIQNNI